MRKILALLVCLPFATVAQINLQQGIKDPSIQLRKFEQFYRYLNGSYVDTVNSERLIEVAIRSMLDELDPHSTFLTAEEMKPVEEQFSGSFSGIGIEFNILQDTILVVNTIPGGPSEKVGLMPNDRIVAVDGESAIGSTNQQVFKLLRGSKGSQVQVEVVRKGTPERLRFRIVRDNIPIYTVDAAYKVDDRTGYIKVNRFAQNTMKEFETAFKKFGKVDALIVDLRGNGGGLLDQAIKMSGFFLARGSNVTMTEGRLSPTERFGTTSDGAFMRGKVILLVDEGSASGSEIVAGATQDWDRGVIVGRRTFGKGLVQRQFKLIDGSAVRITTARYHTPTGRVIQRPFVAGDQDAYYRDFANRIGYQTDTLDSDNTDIYKTLRAGRTVYGGGGIFPDVYVPVDTTGYSEYWGQLIRMGVVNEFVSQYLDANRKKLETAYPSFEVFEKEFIISSGVMDELVALGDVRSVPLDEAGLETSKDRIKLQLKALFAQRLWTMTEYYRIMNAGHNPIFRRAVEILQNWDTDPATRGISGM